VNVATTFEADTKTAEMMQPGMCTLDDPAVLSQTTAVCSAALGEHRESEPKRGRPFPLT